MTEPSAPSAPEMPPKPIPCPWCAYTDVVLKKVMRHMESAHHQRWCDLALYPPIAGGVYW